MIEYNDHFQELSTEDIGKIIKSLKIELASDYSGWSKIVDDRRDGVRKKLKRYENELMDRVLLGEE